MEAFGRGGNGSRKTTGACDRASEKKNNVLPPHLETKEGSTGGLEKGGACDRGRGCVLAYRTIEKGRFERSGSRSIKIGEDFIRNKKGKSLLPTPLLGVEKSMSSEK